MSFPLKSMIRNLGARFLYQLGMTHPARIGWRSFTIVTFHRVLPPELLRQYPHSAIAVTPSIFGECLDFFRSHYDCVTVTDGLRKFSQGENFGKPLLAITFDDGQLDNFQFARPELNQRKIPATFYIPVEAIDSQTSLWHDQIGFYAQQIQKNGAIPTDALKPWFKNPTDFNQSPQDLTDRLTQRAKTLLPEDRSQLISLLRNCAKITEIPTWAGLMTWKQIGQLANEGHEIGSHSMTHPILLQKYQPDLQYELARSKNQLEGVLGRQVSSFAYPNGDYDEETLRFIKRSGYLSAVTTRLGRNEVGADRYQLRRFDMDQRRFMTSRGRLSPSSLAWRLSRTETLHHENRIPHE